MSKIVAEDCRHISIYRLKEWGAFDNDFHWGGVHWTDYWSDQKNSISYKLDRTDPSNMSITLIYTITDSWTGEKHNMEQKYPIVKTQCNYGGTRYWFICSVYHNGAYCGRRVAKLYLCSGSRYFACRHCYDLTYRSRIDGYSYTAPVIDEYADKIKRWYYRGQPTRKHRQYEKMQMSVLNVWSRLLSKVRK